MKTSRAFLVPALAVSLTASATTIPADLTARADELTKQASPNVLAWVNDQGAALAKAHGLIDLSVVKRDIQSKFVMKRAPVSNQSSSATSMSTTNYAILGSMPDGDIEALAFLVLMEAAKSAQEDLKAIMDGVKLINKQKDGLRSVQDTVNKLAASSSPAPTPAPDRVAQLVTAARGIVGKTHGANLAMMTAR